MQDELHKKLLKEGDEVLDELGLYVAVLEVERSPKKPVIRYFVDALQGSVTISDCARANKALQRHFDAQDLYGQEYVMEVSTPGIERRLARPRDFKRFVGKPLRLQVKELVNGQRKFKGTIAQADDQTFTVTTDDGDMTLPYSAIARANLTHDFGKGEK